MVLPDVNILVYAHREDTSQYSAARRWLEETIGSEHAYGISDLVLSGFLRIVTNPQVFLRPSPFKLALAFANEVRDRPNCIRVAPGARHWDIFEKLCQRTNVKGNLVPDAYFAALAIESGCEWISTDHDYARFPGLRWRNPFQS